MGQQNETKMSQRECDPEKAARQRQEEEEEIVPR